MPAVYLHQPWTMPLDLQRRIGCELGRDYPLPIVDWAEAAAMARDRLWSLRREQGFAAAADAIQHRHGSRRSGLARSGGRRRTGRGRGAQPADGLQLALNLEPDSPPDTSA